MNRITVCFMLLSVSLWAAAQSGTPSPYGTSAQAQAPQTMMVPEAVVGPGGLSTIAGTAVVIVPPSAPLLVTPEVHLTTASPGGASNATPGNTVGAVNASSEIPVAPTIITSVPQYVTAGARVTQTLPPEQMPAVFSSAAGSGAAPAWSSAEGEPAPTANNAKIFDLGVGPASGLAAGDKSLVRAARADRRRATGAKEYVYTNENIDRIKPRPLTVGGTPGKPASR